MPNTPSSLGLGMTGLYASSSVTEEDKAFVAHVMQQVGEVLWVEDEDQINTVIAAAGSSPAYFFLFAQAMQDEAMKMGLNKNDARLLVQQAMKGSAEMISHNSNLELSELRAQVTSKGGTTHEAIETFKNNGLEETVAESMRAAVTRAKEMSKQF
jgi:pyrroline-5-carboxylate reductase